MGWRTSASTLFYENRNLPLFITQVPNEFIEYSLEQVLEASKSKRTSYQGDLKNAYFIGASLCLDTKDEFGIENVIIFHYDSEVFFDFVEGFKRLLSIKSIKLLDQIMNINNINKHTKFWLKK